MVAHNTGKVPRYMSQQFISWVFALLGVGVLVPWNAFVSAKPYFEARLCGEGTFFTENIEVWFSLVYNTASVVSLAALLVCQQQQGDESRRNSLIQSLSVRLSSVTSGVTDALREDHNEDHNMRRMTMVSLGLYLVVFCCTTVSVSIPSVPPTLFLTMTLVGLFICGLCTSVASAGIVGTAGLFDAEVGLGPYFQGQALGGLLVAVANFFAAIGSDPKPFREAKCGDPDDDATDQDNTQTCVSYDSISWSTMIFFLLGTLAIAACMLGYGLVEKYKAQRGSYSQVDPPEGQELEEVDTQHIHGENEGAIYQSAHPHIRTGSNSTENQSSPMHGKLPNDQTLPTRLSELETEQTKRMRRLSVRQESMWDLRGIHRLTLEIKRGESDVEENNVALVWRATKWIAYALFNTYVVTLAIFPVITSDLDSMHQCEKGNRLYNDLFVPMTFLVFNLGDLLGRFPITDISATNSTSGIDKNLFWQSVGRWIFVPLFFLCYSKKSVISIRSDFFSWLVQFLFAYTNGALTAQCFTLAPSLIIPPTENLQQISSAILNFSLCSGLLAGSFLAFPLLWTFSGLW